MSGPMTIAPSGRTTPCAEGCRHPTCVALQGEIDAQAKTLRAARVRALVDVVYDALMPKPTITERSEAELALLDLAKMARGEE